MDKPLILRLVDEHRRMVNMKGRRPTKEEALASASRILAQGIVRMMSMDPHEAALAAHIPNVTPSVEELEARIRAKHAAVKAHAVKRR